jgi:molybdenum cofactor cytidylyltransferase
MIVGVLLAAGRSGRFGTEKLIHPLQDGTPMACAAARNLLSATDRVVAVAHPDNATLLSPLGKEGVQVIECAESESGMGHSIACGVRATSEASGWLIALADMPFIRPETIRQVADLLRAGARLAAPLLRGRRGHPVGFNRIFYGELVSLSGDAGARDILDRHAADLHTFSCDDPGTLIDIDTLADLEQAKIE